MPSPVNADNQILGINFDGNGNPTTYKAATFSFDPKDRLTTISSLTFSAAYDGSGLRATKTATLSGITQTTYFVYDGSTPIAEETFNGTSATFTALNAITADGWRARKQGGIVYQFVYDPQGSVQQRHTDGSYTGGYAAYDRSTFEGYGALRQANKGSTGAIVGQHDPAGFGGQFGYYTDTETGLLCLTHRYYDPGTGKFLNRDPIGYQGGANLYGFADGNPVNESDPSGFAGGPGTPGSGNEEESDDIFMQRELQEVIEARREEETREEQEKQGSLGRALELRALLRNRNQPIIRSFPEWRTGGSITQITPQGTFPEWWASTAPAKPYTIQGRYWINRASLAQNNEFTSRQLGQMQMGFAPSARVMVRNNRTSLIETRNVSKELHHSGGRNIPNANEPFYIYEVWPWQHAGIDPQRNTGYTFLQFMK